MTTEPRGRRRAITALALLAPVPSIGVIAAMVAAPGLFGHAVYLAAKIWILTFPALWYLVVERGRPSWSPPRNGGLGVGLASGFTIALAIVLGAWLMGVQRMDLGPLRSAVQEMGLGAPAVYLAAAAGWTLVNSLVEEYVYRWFVVRQSEKLFSPAGAILLSAVIFTVHHIIAVSLYLSPFHTVLASTGVFAGGVIWAWFYVRYRSIWPGWISHILADVAVFGVGWWLLFS